MNLYVQSSKEIIRKAQGTFNPQGPVYYNPAATQSQPATPPIQQASENEIPRILQNLMRSAKNFASAFNQETKLFNTSMQRLKQVMADLGAVDWGNTAIDRQTFKQNAANLQKMLDNATQEDAQDINFLQQLSTQAHSLAQSTGMSQIPTQQSQPQVATPTVAPTTPAIPAPSVAPTTPLGRGWGTGIGQWFGNLKNIPSNLMRGYRSQTASSKNYLTAGMSSINYRS